MGVGVGVDLGVSGTGQCHRQDDRRRCRMSHMDRECDSGTNLGGSCNTG